jgi:hypothetical protein
MMNDELPEHTPIGVGLISLIHHSSFILHRFAGFGLDETASTA